MFELRKLSYEKDSFDDFLSPTTFYFHHGKHHQNYINNLNNLIQNSRLENANLYDIIKQTNGALFNNAAQIYNHDFYWDCIAPVSQIDQINADFQNALELNFNGLDSFKEKFLSAANAIFGSGWCWLVLNLENNKLEIIQTSNANTPIVDEKIPLLVVDVWEHAYYIDHKNARASYLEKFFNHINWAFVSTAFNWGKKEGFNSVKFYIHNLHGK